MSIKGLTTNRAALPHIGELRKGAPKAERGPGRDLKHFRFTSNESGLVEIFEQHYGKEPTDIHVFLAYRTTEENFPTWQEHWKGGGLVHRCDGETCTDWLGQDGKLHRSTDANLRQPPPPCPGECKPVGRLNVIIPELDRLALVTALTTSVYDIAQIHQNLSAYESLRGDLRGIPFILKRRPQMISVNRDGRRSRMEKHLLSIECAPRYVAIELTAMERAALPAAITDLIVAAEDEPSDAGVPATETPEAQAAQVEMIDREQYQKIQELGLELITLGIWENKKQGRAFMKARFPQADSSGDLSYQEAAQLIFALDKLAMPARKQPISEDDIPF